MTGALAEHFGAAAVWRGAQAACTCGCGCPTAPMRRDWSPPRRGPA